MLTNIRRFLFLGIAVALLVLSGMLIRPLHRQQIRYDLTSAPVRGVSPEVVLATTALGAFRGVIVDVVWIRMENLKNEGKFFEIVQLADLACRLAPRFPKVWDFNAWNMAYNVSVQVPEYSQRWPWVRKGIELLRSEGIPRNPNEPELYFSLAWIFMHKVGDQLDDAHFWYKQQLGMRMHEILGGAGDRDTLQRFMDAPRTRRDLLREPELKDLYLRLVDAGFDPLRRHPEQDVPGYLVYVRRPDSIPERAVEVLEAERNKDQVRRIADFVRARYLHEELRMKPRRMLELMERFGPFDWRSPFSHSVYWASEGRRVAEAYRERVASRVRQRGGDPEKIDWGSDYPSYRYNDINYDRVIYGALQKLVTNGRLLYDNQGQVMPLMGPDYAFSDAMIDYYQKMQEKYGEEGRYPGVKSAYRYFLERVVVEFYYMGAQQDSRRYYSLLREEYSGDYPASYDRFLMDKLSRYVSEVGPTRFRNFIRGLILRAYRNLGAGADDRAQALHTRARRATELWNEKEKVEESPKISRMADFDRIRRSVLLDMFSGRLRVAEPVLNGLRARLPQDVVGALEEAAREGKELRQLKPFEVPERFQKSSDK